MAWPLTPLTTYVASTTPAIKASDLNSIQSGVNGIVAATYSLAAVVLDGTGGNVVTPTAGTVKISGSTGVGSSLPTSTIPVGTMYKQHVFAAMIYFQGAASPTIASAINVSSLSRTSAGFYLVNLNVSITNMICMATVQNAGAAITISAGQTSATQIQLETVNSSATHVDVGATLVVFAN